MVLQRVKAIEKLSQDSEVAKLLKVSAGTIASYKQRGYVPLDKIEDYGRRRGVSMEWLVNGNGPVYVRDMVTEPGAIYQVATNQDAVYRIAAKVADCLVNSKLKLSPEKIEKIVRMFHRDALAVGADDVPAEKIRSYLELME